MAAYIMFYWQIINIAYLGAVKGCFPDLFIVYNLLPVETWAFIWKKCCVPGRDLTCLQGFVFKWRAAWLSCPQSVGGNHPELIFCPGEQIHHCGRLLVPLHVCRSYREMHRFHFTAFLGPQRGMLKHYTIEQKITLKQQWSSIFGFHSYILSHWGMT